MHSIKQRFRRALAMAVNIVAIAYPVASTATPVVYGFESFIDGTPITSQIVGLSFGQATAIQAGVSLNEFEFPPRSGRTVLYDDGAPITITFSLPVFDVGGYFTYVSGLNLSAYDALDNLLGSDMSDFTSNLALSGVGGSHPNEFLNFASATGLIAKVVITGDASGSSFTLDDLTVDAAVNSVPEPATLALVAVALGAASYRNFKWRRSSLKLGQL